jgi:hypothetical protein
MPYPFRTTKNYIDWDKIIRSIVPMSGDKNTVALVVDRSEPVATELVIEYRTIIKTWQDANYDLEKIEWYDYYPGDHFDVEIQNTFAKIVEAVPKRVFISEVMPGRCVPYHWDVEDEEKEWLKEGKLVRYVCFIDKPKFGHVFLFKNMDSFCSTEDFTVLSYVCVTNLNHEQTHKDFFGRYSHTRSLCCFGRCKSI